MSKEVKKIAKLITLAEENPEELEKILKTSENSDKIAKVVGFTGSPGSGKSTLINAVIEHLRKKDKSVAVLAVDPQSPLSGGAFFGDRIRMQQHYLDEKIFIRSVSGSIKSGVSPTIQSLVRIFEVFDFDYILVESVGTGQSEIDLSFFVDVLVLVLSPGSGDDIQLLKAGILEIADIYAVNKSDLTEYSRFFNLLKSQPIFDDNKMMIRVSGISREGVDDLCKAIDDLWSKLSKTGALVKKRKRAILKQAELLIIEKLEEIVNLESVPNFKTLKEAEVFLKKKLVDELEG